MAVDWNKITYQQLLDLAKQQAPSASGAYQNVSLSNDSGVDPNNARIDLSSLGINGTSEVVNTRDQGLVFAMDDPNNPGKYVAVRSADHPGIKDSLVGGSFGGAGGVNVTTTSRNETLVDKLIPVIVAAGAGAVALNAAGILGEAVAPAASSAPVSSVAGVAGEAGAAVPVGDLGIGAAGGGAVPTEAAGGLFGDGGGLLGQGITAATPAAPVSSVAGAAGEAAASVPVGDLGIGAAGGEIPTAGAGGLSVGGDQLANEATKLTAQNAASPGSLLPSSAPSVNTTGGGLLDTIKGVAGNTNPLSTLSNLVGSGVQGVTANNVAGTLAGASTGAANTLAGAATQAGTINANAATQAAGTLAGAATGAGKTIADAYNTGGTNLANTQTAGGKALSAADLAAADIMSGAYGTATAQQVAAIQKAMQENDKTLEQQTANQQPYMKAGTDALAQLSAGLQPGGQYNKPFTMADAQNTDAYKFALDQGKQAINSAAGAGGLQLSSANLQNLGTFAEGTAAQYQQQAFNQWMAQNNMSMAGLQNLVATGQISVGQLQTALAQHGISAETLQQNIGNAQAAGTLGAAGAQATGTVNSAKDLTNANNAAAGTLYNSGLGAAGATAAGTIGAGNATAAGQIGSANATAGGITGAANATAAGQVGAGNATAAGQTATGNAITSGLGSLASGLINSGAGSSILSGIGSIFGV